MLLVQAPPPSQRDKRPLSHGFSDTTSLPLPNAFPTPPGTSLPHWPTPSPPLVPFPVLQLAANRYVVSLVPTRIRKFLSDLTTGRDISVDMLNVDILVNLDPTLCSLILDNAIVNAFKHGDERNPAVRVAVTTTDDGDDKIKVQFTITNRANQQSTRLSQTFVEKMFNGDSHDTPAANPWSDRIGLQHSRLAARAHNIALSLEQMDDTVTFQATLTTTRAAHTPLILSASQQDVSSFPKNSLRIYYIDDSAMARRIMESCLQQVCTALYSFGQCSIRTHN